MEHLQQLLGENILKNLDKYVCFSLWESCVLLMRPS
jgi:hypothetical protein